MAIQLVDDLYNIEQLQQRPDEQIPPGMFVVEVATLHFGHPSNEQPIGKFIKE